MMSNTTKDGIEVAVGQVWRDLDNRMGGRTVTVLSVADGKAHVMGAAKTRLSVSRMHKGSTGWVLVSEPSASKPGNGL